MNTEALKKLAQTTLDEMKAHDITILDVQKLTNVTDWMIICTGTSRRHIQSIAEQLVTNAKQSHLQPLGVEGKSTDSWILIDLGSVVVHVMMPEAREFYSLEKLWSNLETAREDLENN